MDIVLGSLEDFDGLDVFDGFDNFEEGGEEEE